MVDLTLELFPTIPPRPCSSVAKKTHKLTPIEKKERDYLRKKEQAKSRVQAIKDQENQAKILQERKLQSIQWHRQESAEEGKQTNTQSFKSTFIYSCIHVFYVIVIEQLLKRFERDTIDPYKQNPATAGYEFRKSTSGKIHESSPVFWGHSMAILPISQVPKVSKELVDVKKIPIGDQAIHPASFGYTMARNNEATVISPIFFFSDFNKIPLSKFVSSHTTQEESKSLLEDIHAATVGEDIEDFESEAAILKRTGLDKKTFLYHQQKRLEEILKARFESPNECLVCKSSQALGCPSCFMYIPMKQQKLLDACATAQKTLSLEQQQQLYQEKQQALQQETLLTASTDGAAIIQKIAQAQEETEYYANLLTDFRMIRKHRTMYVHL
jgi:hypothetical protein